MWASALAALVVVACSASSVTLSQLVADEEAFIGRQVDVEGRVVAFLDPDGTEYFVLEDASQNRVMLLPTDLVRGYVGETIEVVGRFDFDPNAGRILEVEEIRARSGSSSGPGS